MDSRVSISYRPLWESLEQQNLSKTDLIRVAHITPSTLARLSKNEPVSLETLTKLSANLKLPIERILELQHTADLLTSNGTFLPNKSEAVHRWFPYLEGYSKQLVENELSHLEDISTVYDPFAGSGTTPLVAAMNGLEGLYSEINPVMRFIADGKVCVAARVAKDRQSKLELRDFIDYLRPQIKAPCGISDFSLGSFDKYFTDESLAHIGYYMKAVQSSLNRDVEVLAWLALASVAVSVSKMIRRGDLRFATAKEAQKINAPFWPSIITKLEQISRDVEELAELEMGTSSFVSSDVRDSHLNRTVDAVVTSPPYLNGTNYFRNTKLELRLLDFIQTEQELSGYYQTGITAGINNVSKRRKKPKVSEDLRGLLKNLEDTAYDSRIPLMVAGYFDDMEGAIAAIHASLRPGGSLVLDIGDSQFSGVHVATHELLDSRIRAIGFISKEHTILRTRRSRNGQLLSQRILRYTKA